MMRMTRWLQLLVLTVLCTACSGLRANSPTEAAATLLPLHGTSAQSISLKAGGESAHIRFSAIEAAGSYGRLELPPGRSVVESEWTYSGDAVVLTIPTATGADFGIAPVGGSGPVTAELSLQFGRSVKLAADAPQGSHNRVTDLEITEFDEGEVLLEWTEVNTGDYDFNGEVNISDIAPVALHYGMTYSSQAENPLELTEYWIDGDGNGEINVADLTPLALNFGHQVAGYYILHNGFRVKEPESATPQLFSRADAEFRLQPNPLPPRYSAVVDGLTSDSWSVVPVDSDRNEGTISAGTISGKTIDAKASVIISGINLWQFEDSKEDSGFSKMWVILPGDDVDWAHIGEKYVGPNGVAVFAGLPKNTELFLEIAYAPKTNLLTGEPATREEATASPFRTRMPFMLPETEDVIEFSPEIKVASLENGIRVDLFAQLPGPEGTETLRSRLLLPAGLVSYDTDGDASYIDQPFLGDSDNDSISDKRIELLLDRRAYEGGAQDEPLHMGIVTIFDEASGYIVLSDASYWDPEAPSEDGKGDWVPLPFPREVQYNFYELTEFVDPAKTYMTPGSIILGEELEVTGLLLTNSLKGLPPKNWASQVSRPKEP